MANEKKAAKTPSKLEAAPQSEPKHEQSATAKIADKAKAEKPTQTTNALLQAWFKAQSTITAPVRTAIEDTINVVSDALATRADGYLSVGVRLRKLQAEIGDVLFTSFLEDSGVLQSLQVGAAQARQYMEQSKFVEDKIRNKIARKCLMMFGQRGIVVPKYIFKSKDEKAAPTYSTDKINADGRIGERAGLDFSPFVLAALEKYPEPKPTADSATCEVWAREVIYHANTLRSQYSADFRKKNPRMAVGINRKRIRQMAVNFFTYGEYDAKLLMFDIIREYGKKFSADATEEIAGELVQVALARDWEEGADKLLPAKTTAYSAEEKMKREAILAKAQQASKAHVPAHRQSVQQ